MAPADQGEEDGEQFIKRPHVASEYSRQPCLQHLQV